MASKSQKNPNPVQTIEITNFGGRLTRIINGDMNSGFAKFATSWGYDPFSKPMNLTWFEQPTDITGPITDLIIAGKKFYGNAGNLNTSSYNVVFLLGNSGKVYVVQPSSPASVVSSNPSVVGVANTDSVLGSVQVANSPTFNFGGSLEVFAQPSIYGTSNALYVGSDAFISTIPLGSINGTQTKVNGGYVGTLTNSTGAFRPMKVFQGLLRFSNAGTIGTIGAGATIVSLYNASIRGVLNASSDLQTPLPINAEIQDIEVSIDGNYLLIATSNIDNEQIANFGSDYVYSSGDDSVLYGWNGSDPNITTETAMPSISLTALQTYLGNNLFFSQDGFGTSITDGVNKILTLPGNKAPFANATAVNGNFLSWVSTEDSSSSNSTYATLYYFGGLDQENPPGLYRMSRITSSSAFVYSSPLNLLVDNKYSSVPSIVSSGSTVNPIGYGKHYISLVGPGFGGTANITKLYRFLINSTGSGTPQLGVYETQSQIFSKKVTVKQMRIYTEPTVSGNGVQVDLIGSNGSPITNGTFTYSYSAGTDITQAQGSLDRIDWNPAMNTSYVLGLRLTNTGTTNMTIHKIEIDYIFSGK